MADALRRESWDHTAHLLAAVSNVFGGKKDGEPFLPRDFSPYPEDYDQAPAEPLTPNPMGIDVLQYLLTPEDRRKIKRGKRSQSG